MLDLSSIKTKPIWQMTGEEFIALQQLSFEAATKTAEPQAEEKPTEKYVYGMGGLASIFHCSKVKAQKIKNSGVINAAITQTGRKIVIDAELALRLVREDNERRQRRAERRR